MDIASIDEKIELCSLSIRAELAYAVEHCSESESENLVSSCVDIPKSVKDDDGVRIIMLLINRHIEFLGAPSLSDGKRVELENSSRGLLKFIRYPRGMKENLPEQQTRSVEAVMGLRYYQVMAVREAIEKLHIPGSRVMLHAPTGAGKTRMAMSIVATHFRVHGPTAVLWLASGSELIDQAASAFEETWKHHGDIKAMLHLWRGDSPQFEPQHEPTRNCMLVSGLQKVSRAWNDNKNLVLDLQKMVSLIVFDEAHQTAAESYRRLVEEVMKGAKCRLLGLSATPGRARDEESHELTRIYSGDKVSVCSPDGRGVIEYLVHKGYLADAEFHVILEKDLYAEGEQNLGEAGRNFSRNRKIVDIVEEAIQKGHKRIIVFSPSVDSAHMCAAMLKSFCGIKNSNALDASTPKEERNEIIKRYSIADDEDIHIILNCEVLTQGFDAPCTSAVVIARPTESVGLYSQMVGRAIRGPASKGNSHADIYTVVGTERPEFRDIASAFERWNNLWEESNND